MNNVPPEQEPDAPVFGERRLAMVQEVAELAEAIKPEAGGAGISPRVLAVLVCGAALVVAFALAGSLPLLRAKPALALREL